MFFLHKTRLCNFFRNIHGRWFMFICASFCAQIWWLLDETLYIKMLPQRLPILGFFNIMQTRCQTPWKKCKDTIQQVSFPTTRVMRRTCLNSNRLSLSHSAWDRDSSDNLTFLVCPVTSNPTSWLLFVHSTSTATQQYLTRAPWSSTTAVRVRVRKTPSEKFLKIRKVFVTSSFLAEEFSDILRYKVSRWYAKCPDELESFRTILKVSG